MAYSSDAMVSHDVFGLVVCAPVAGVSVGSGSGLGVGPLVRHLDALNHCPAGCNGRYYPMLETEMPWLGVEKLAGQTVVWDSPFVTKAAWNATCLQGFGCDVGFPTPTADDLSQRVTCNGCCQTVGFPICYQHSQGFLQFCMCVVGSVILVALLKLCCTMLCTKKSAAWTVAGHQRKTGHAKRVLLLKRAVLVQGRKRKRLKLRQEKSEPVSGKRVHLAKCRMLGLGGGISVRRPGARMSFRLCLCKFRNLRIQTWLKGRPSCGRHVPLKFWRRPQEQWVFQSIVPTPEDAVHEPQTAGLLSALGRPARRLLWQGGGGGAEVTKRQRQEKILMEGLQALLARIEDVQDDQRFFLVDPIARRAKACPRTTTREKGREANLGLRPPPRVGKLASLPLILNSLRLKPLSAICLHSSLKALILECENSGTDGILTKVRRLAQAFPAEGTQQPKPRAQAEVAVPPPRANDKRPKKPAGGPRDGSGSATLALDSRWWPGKLCSPKALDKRLEEGEDPGSDLAVVLSLEEALSCRRLAAVHSLQSKVALILRDYSGDSAPENFTADGKWIQVWAAAFAKEGPAWGPEPGVVTCKKVPGAVKQATLRVIVPRAFQSTLDWDEICKKPACALRALLPPDVAVRSYGWHRLESRDESVVGFFKLPESQCASVLTASGTRGIFVKRVDAQNDPDHFVPVSWILNPEKLKAHAYFAMAKREADKQGAGSAFRTGGGACLGLVGVQVAEEGDARARRRSISWTPAQLQQLLQDEKWRVIADIQAPARPKKVWTFTAAPPQSGSGQWILHCGEQGTIQISPWRKLVDKPPPMPIRGPAGWVSKPKKEEAATLQPAKMCGKEQKPEMHGDSPKVDDSLKGTNAQDVCMERGDNRSPQNSPAKPPPNVPKVDPPPVRDSKELGPDEVATWDLGGAGDCGLRCLAAAKSVRNGAPKDQVSAKISRVALSLRTKAAAWLLEWFRDAECSENTEGGSVPDDAAQYLEATKRPTKWLGPWMAMACANVLETDILVFKFLRGSWKFLERVVPNKRTAQTPLVLFLQDGHFRTLPPETEHPHRWSRLGQQELHTKASQSYLGGMPTKDSDSEFSAWLRPTDLCKGAAFQAPETQQENWDPLSFVAAPRDQATPFSGGQLSKKLDGKIVFWDGGQQTRPPSSGIQLVISDPFSAVSEKEDRATPSFGGRSPTKFNEQTTVGACEPQTRPPHCGASSSGTFEGSAGKFGPIHFCFCAARPDELSFRGTLVTCPIKEESTKARVLQWLPGGFAFSPLVLLCRLRENLSLPCLRTPAALRS